MKTEVKKLEKLKIALTVDIAAQELKEEKDAHYKEMSKTIKVSGFRPGMAPLDILERQHGPYLKEKFVEKVLPQYYAKALEAERLVPAAMPRIYDVSYEKDTLKFSAELEIKPVLDIKEDDYRGIKVSEKMIEIKAEEVEKIITNIKEKIKNSSNRDVSDEEIARWAGYKDITDLKKSIDVELATQKLHERTRKMNVQISQHLLKKIKFEIPRGQVEHHQKELLERELYNLRMRGISDADIEKYKKDLEEKIKTVAEDEVRLLYILETIAQKENLKIENNLGEIVLGYLLSLSQYPN